MYLLKLSLDHPEIGEEEVKQLLKPKNLSKIANFLIADIDDLKYCSRLAYIHSVYEILFTANDENLRLKTSFHNWSKYKGSFAVRCSDKNIEREIALLIYNQIKKSRKPNVNLEKPDNKFEVIQLGSKYYLAKHVLDTDKSYLEHFGRHRPAKHPTTMDPKLSRACINLTGLTEGNLLDLFCGSGGILIEAGFLGFKVTGYDLDKYVLNKAKINLKFYKIKNATLEVKDALKIDKKFDTVVTDLPYGKSTKLFERTLLSLYNKFFKIIKKYVKNKIVVILPSNINYKPPHFKVIKKFTFYLNKSLSKKVYLLQ